MVTMGSWGVDLDGRDVDVRPQDDFFRYAGGSWLDRFEIPEDMAAYGSFTELFLRSEREVQAIIEELSAQPNPPGSDAQKIADLYKDYVDRDSIESRGLAPVAADLDRVRQAQSPADIARLLAEYSRLGCATPFAFYVDQDAKQPDRYLVHFIQDGLGLPDRDYYLERDNGRFLKATNARLAFLGELLDRAGEPAARAEQVLALEQRLAKAHWPKEKLRDVEATYNKYSTADLQKLAPEFPWGDYLTAYGLGEQEIVVSAPSAYTEMATVFASTPLEDWRAYLVCSILSTCAPLLPKALDDAQFRFHSAAVTGSDKQRDREKRAVQFVNNALGEAVGRIYVEHHFPPEAKARIDSLTQNVMRAMAERINNLPWMGNATKAQARDKLAKFTVKIGYPARWRDYSTLEIRPGDLVGNAKRTALFEYKRNIDKLGAAVDRDEWHMTPQTVNAYYNPSMNEIVFPAAILQPPFFDPAADDAVNYGAIGAVIGHEIGHGFDDQGRKVDGSGVQRDWWTDEDANRFRERAERLVAQFDRYSPLEGMHVNGRLTLGENIGDLGGIELAYHAYKLSLEGQPAPVIDGLTGDQRFFLGYAQIWRGKMRDEFLAMLVASNPHSPAEFRVNGAVRNVDAWYDAFDVGDKDAMFLPPEERVHIW